MTDWQDLGDDELRARLRQHGARLDDIGPAVMNREDPEVAAYITEVLSR